MSPRSPHTSAQPLETPEVLIPQSTALEVSSGPTGLPALPAELGAFTGLENLDPSSFVIPRIKIVQPTSKEGTPGALRINLTGDEFSELPVIVVKAVQGRVLWDPDQKNDKALCRSYDFLVPDPSIENPFSPVCAKKIVNPRRQEVLTPVCQQAKWEGSKRPECNETYNLLCLQAQDFLPFWISLAGASITPVKRYLSAIALRRSRLFAWETVLHCEERKDPNRYYVAGFTAPRLLDPERAALVAQTIVDLELASIDIRRTLEAEEGALQEDNTQCSDAPPDAPDWLNQ